MRLRLADPATERERGRAGRGPVEHLAMHGFICDVAYDPVSLATVLDGEPLQVAAVRERGGDRFVVRFRGTAYLHEDTRALREPRLRGACEALLAAKREADRRRDEWRRTAERDRATARQAVIEQLAREG